MHLKVLFVFSKNGPAFKIGHTDLDDVKNIGKYLSNLLMPKHAFKGFILFFEKKLPYL